MNKDDFNNIKVPKNIDEIIDKSFEDAYKLKNKKRTKKISGIIAASLACFTILGSNGEAVANVITDLQKIFIQLEDRIENNGENIIYGTTIGETVSNNGIDVTLKDVTSNGKLLYVEYRIESEEPLINNSEESGQHQILYEHKEKVSFNGEVSDISGTAGIEGKFIDDYTFEGVEKYELNSLEGETPENFEFEVLINLFRTPSFEVDESPEAMKVGDWGFRVNVATEDDILKTFELNLETEEGITLKDIIVTPYEIYVNILHEKEELLPSSYIVNIKDKNKNELKKEVMIGDYKYNRITFNKEASVGDEVTIEITDTSPDRNLILKEEITLE